MRQYCERSCNGKYCPLWKDDAASVIDALSRDGSVLDGQLDLEKIGYFGMSFGGCSAFYTPHFDSRVKAAVNLDGVLCGGQRSLEPVDIPLMLCGQRTDMLRDSGVNPAQKLTCILFEDALHSDFTNLPLWMEQLFRCNAGFITLQISQREDMARMSIIRAIWMFNIEAVFQ